MILISPFFTPLHFFALNFTFLHSFSLFYTDLVLIDMFLSNQNAHIVACILLGRQENNLLLIFFLQCKYKMHLLILSLSGIWKVFQITLA